MNYCDQKQASRSENQPRGNRSQSELLANSSQEFPQKSRSCRVQATVSLLPPSDIGTRGIQLSKAYKTAYR